MSIVFAGWAHLNKLVILLCREGSPLTALLSNSKAQMIRFSKPHQHMLSCQQQAWRGELKTFFVELQESLFAGSGRLVIDCLVEGSWGSSWCDFQVAKSAAAGTKIFTRTGLGVTHKWGG